MRGATTDQRSAANDASTSQLFPLAAVVVVGSVCLAVRVVLDDAGGNAGGAAQLAWWVGLITFSATLAAVYVKVTGDRWLLAAVGVGLTVLGIYGLTSGWPYLPGGLLFVTAGAAPSVWRRSGTPLTATAVVVTAAIALLPLAT